MTWTTSLFVTADIMNTHIRDNLIAIDGFLDTSCIPGSTILPLICDSLGGTDGHRPVVDGTAYEEWHLCNGDADIDGLGYTAPNMINYFPIGAGSTYAQDATGGSMSSNNAHTHDAGTLETAVDAGGLKDHTHTLSTTTSGPDTNIDTGGANPPISSSTHTHTFSGTSGNPTTHATHTHTTSGTSASAGSAAQNVRPPYIAHYYFLYIGG